MSNNFSYSETSSFLLCKRKHYYGYTRSLERVSTSSSLALGSAGHKLLEVFYKSILEDGSYDDRKLQLAAFDTALSKAWAAYEQMVKDGWVDSDRQRPLAEIIFQWYFPNEPFVRGGWLILAAEQDFVLKYDTEQDTGFRFVVDLIANDPKGKMVVIDHKFLYDFYNYDAAALQPQIPLYIGALRAMGHKVSYGAYNMLRNRKMKAPTLEQSISYLELKPTDTRVQRSFRDQIDVAEEIKAVRELTPEQQDLKAHRVANKMVCQSCSFKDLCVTELMGANTQLMIQAEYKIRERHAVAANVIGLEDETE